MGLFRSISEFFKSLGHQAEGTIDEAADRMRSDAGALKSKYDDVIRDKIKNIKDYRGALANMVHQKDKMIDKAKDLTAEVGKLEDLKAGAAAKVRKMVSTMKGDGKTETDIAADDDFLQGKESFAKFSEALTSKQAEIQDLERRAAEIEGKMGGHKEQLAKMLKDIDKLRDEAAESVAEVAAAGEETAARDMLNTATGGSKADDELAKLREIRARSTAEARISHELAGDNADADELTREFLEKAQEDSIADDFASLVGLEEGSPAAAPAKPSSIPSAGSSILDTVKDAASDAASDAAKNASDAAKNAGDDFKFPE